MDCSIIIINYNTRDLTLACLDSLYRFTEGLMWEIILVDNASTECDPSIFKEKFPNIELIQSKRNTGFAGGNNIGIAKARGKYVLLLNSDIELYENAVGRAFQFMETNIKAGVCSIRLKYPDGRIQSVAQRFPSVTYKLAELFRFQKLLGKRLGGRLLLGSFFDYQTTTKVDWVWGAFFLFRRSMLDMLPERKLNESYFMYAEDKQWCFDFRKLGWEVWFLGNTEAIHHMGGSSGQKDILMKQGNNYFLKNNYKWINRQFIKVIDKLFSL